MTKADHKRGTLHLKCIECGHEQYVSPTCAVSLRGKLGYYYGSDADFCQKCDGHLTILKEYD